MANKEYFDMLLNNFRLSEAIGYITAVEDKGKISTVRREACKNLIECYKNIINNCLWNEEGIYLLEVKEVDDLPKDIVEEIQRLTSVIQNWTSNNKSMLLMFVSTYYAMVNGDRLHFRVNLDKLWNQIEEKKISYNGQTIGGYEEFHKIGNILEKYYSLNDGIFYAIKEAVIRINLFDEE